MSFSHIFRFQKLLQKIMRLPGYFEGSKYRKKQRGFPGTKKHFVVTDNAHNSGSEPKIMQSPGKVNKTAPF